MIKNLCVIGDIILDEYWHGITERICPEAPVPVLKLTNTEHRLGGAANVALNAKQLSENVHLLGFSGRDDKSITLETLLKKNNITHHLIQTKSPTIVKLRALSDWHQLLRIDIEENIYSKKEKDHVISKLKKIIKNLDVIVLSDYNKGVLSNCSEIINIAKKHNIPVIVDPKSNDFSVYANCDIITPNLKEFFLATKKCDTIKEIVEEARKIQKAHNISKFLITMGGKGMLAIDENSYEKIDVNKIEVYDVTGAGDTVVATLASNLDKGFIPAAKIANFAASVVVSKPGTSTITKEELNRFNKTTIQSKIINTASQISKSEKDTLVFTNGCFDIIHSGHVKYLAEAKSLGNKLIVAVNTDASVAKIKGNSRPINSLEHRMNVLAAIESVDYVIAFKEDTPEKLIEQINPDILVKGGDYNDIYALPGAHHVLKNNGKVKLLSLEPNCSTTNIIKKIEATS